MYKNIPNPNSILIGLSYRIKRNTKLLKLSSKCAEQLANIKSLNQIKRDKNTRIMFFFNTNLYLIKRFEMCKNDIPIHKHSEIKHKIVNQVFYNDKSLHPSLPNLVEIFDYKKYPISKNNNKEDILPLHKYSESVYRIKNQRKKKSCKYQRLYKLQQKFFIFRNMI